MKTRLLGAAAALMLAVLGTYLLLSYVSKADERALAGTEVVDVLVVIADIASGTPGEDLSDLVETRAIPASAVVPGGVQALEDLAGLVALVDLEPGEQLLTSRFALPAELELEGQ